MSDYEELRAEIAALRSEVSALRGEEQVSRRGLLGKLAGAAVAGAGLSVLGSSPAEASTGTMVYGTSMNSGTDGTYLTGSTSPQYVLSVAQAGAGTAFNANVTNTGNSQPTVLVQHNGSGIPIEALVLGTGGSAVHGVASNGNGLHGEGYVGALGQGSGIGVYGYSTDGRAVYGYSDTGEALYGYSNGTYGMWAHGAKAQLFLDPTGHTAGAPTSGTHEKGAVRLDANGTLWICVAGGTPGTWVRPGFNPLVKRLVSASTATGTFTAAQKKDVTVSGLPTGVGAVAVNITATSTGSGSVTAYPYGTTRPGVAHLAVNPQYRWTGFAIVKLGSGNRFSIYNSAGRPRCLSTSPASSRRPGGPLREVTSPARVTASGQNI